MATRSSGRTPKVKGGYPTGVTNARNDALTATESNHNRDRQKSQHNSPARNSHESLFSQGTIAFDLGLTNDIDIDGTIYVPHSQATSSYVNTQVSVICMFDVDSQTGDDYVSDWEWLDPKHSPMAALQSLPLTTTFMLQYFSETVAVELVTIDDERNGWRSIVLPLAHKYDLIANSVQAAAAFHFSDNVSRHLGHPRDFYNRAIDGLRQNQELSAYDARKKHVILISLLVLLVVTMVNGSSDFRSIFRLLETAWEAGGGDEELGQGELGLFVIRQYLKFRGYAAPALSRSQGVEVLSHTAFKRPLDSRGWDDFRSYIPLYPEHHEAMSLICDLMEQACALYIERVALGCGAGPLTERVERLKTTMEAFPTGSPLEHVLVWVCFFGAVESSTEGQHEYFIQKLMLHHQRNGFANITNAIEYLQQRRSKEGTLLAWHEDFPTLPFFVV
ncbi:hypothetical protein yc1106_05884 [Curvularia clavata]|uniref:Uncharacterized protein n=1 Tax=Curvularia clavata TaxID=95742 RepID=A0A9Q9DU39_CURCL|nr:hypothetical protein yc1106_05884 [Curvularia clavata]